MMNTKLSIQITRHILFVIIFIFFSTIQAKSLDKFNKAENIANYFSGILLLQESRYDESFQYFKKLSGLEESHSTFSGKYLYSLINSGNFDQAFNYSKKLEKDKKDTYESDLIIGVYYLKNSKFEFSKKYFYKAKNRNARSLLDKYVANSLYNWSNLGEGDFDSAKSRIYQLDDRFENLKKIQNIFLNCFFESIKTETLFVDLISNEKTDFSRYNYFYARYLERIGSRDRAEKVIDEALLKYPRNLILNQYKIDFINSKKKN